MASFSFSSALDGGGQILAKTETIAGEAAHVLDIEGDTVTDQAFALAFTKAKLRGLYLLSNQDMTIETNSSSSPQDTITLTADIPVMWTEGNAGFIPNPFGGNVTAGYITCAEDDWTLKGILVIDPT